MATSALLSEAVGVDLTTNEGIGNLQQTNIRRLQKARTVFEVAEGVTSNIPATAETEQPDTNMHTMLKKFQKLSIKELKLWWEISTLQNYLKVGRVPRGLRIKKFPAFEIQDKGLMDDWYGVLTDCSLKLMKILIDKYQQEQERLGQEITQIETIMNVYKGNSDFEKFIKKMKIDIDTLENKIMEMKQRKFLRDKSDYDQNRVFSWGMRLNPQRGRWERMKPTLKTERYRGQGNRINADISCAGSEVSSPSVSFLVTSGSDLDASQEEEDDESINLIKRKRTENGKGAREEEIINIKRTTGPKKGKSKMVAKKR
ncbi:uncharacterized protein LOC121395395 [Xenopus laevis]|uniref:Uncharacterized protein LOC121395395 n=1 Tax=Xenopus laevis TaxID=8355 RepID=A0A8J1L5B0_XENLA|nr:uncharacterized protein LOC121395395 [Xenopus laevis]